MYMAEHSCTRLHTPVHGCILQHLSQRLLQLCALRILNTRCAPRPHERRHIRHDGCTRLHVYSSTWLHTAVHGSSTWPPCCGSAASTPRKPLGWSDPEGCPQRLLQLCALSILDTSSAITRSARGADVGTLSGWYRTYRQYKQAGRTFAAAQCVWAQLPSIHDCGFPQPAAQQSYDNKR
jgi:hypothetical protein